MFKLSVISPAATYALSKSITSVDEGSQVTITLDTTGVQHGHHIPYTISGTGVTTGDFVGLSSMTGEFVIHSNTSNVTFTIFNDMITEGLEVLTITLPNGDTLSVNINDTSNVPPLAYKLTSTLPAGRVPYVTGLGTNTVSSSDPGYINWCYADGAGVAAGGRHFYSVTDVSGSSVFISTVNGDGSTFYISDSFGFMQLEPYHTYDIFVDRVVTNTTATTIHKYDQNGTFIQSYGPIYRSVPSSHTVYPSVGVHKANNVQPGGTSTVVLNPPTRSNTLSGYIKWLP